MEFRVHKRNNSKKWIEGKLNKNFLHFLPNLMIFQSSVAHLAHTALKNHQICMAKFLVKSEENTCSTFLQPNNTQWSFQNLKSKFRVVPESIINNGATALFTIFFGPHEFFVN